MLHEAKPPRIREILEVLDVHQVRFIVTGSVAALLHGVSLEPGDLDVVPATDIENLGRLVDVLKILEARPPGPFGEWTNLSNGEKKWIARPTTREEIEAWAPNVHDLSSLDALYTSRLGNFDVVPSLTGTYDVLNGRAVQIPAFGRPVWVAHIDELLARLTVPRREKDVTRVALLRDIQRRRVETDST